MLYVQVKHIRSIILSTHKTVYETVYQKKMNVLLPLTDKNDVFLKSGNEKLPTELPCPNLSSGQHKLLLYVQLNVSFSSPEPSAHR